MKTRATLLTLMLTLFSFTNLSVRAEHVGWPANYGGVMLQGFYWDSYSDTQWSYLEEQAPELARYFNLIWVPQSGNCNTTGNVMGYMPVYYFNHNSSFGTENQLRSMISTYKKLGTGIIADVVVNHRNNMGVNSSWLDFPAETYNGVTYQMKSTDVVADDDGGKTKTWANSNGLYISSNNDEGEGWDGCRDLDHKSANVQKCIKAYLSYLINDLGYTGFRYDMVKGFYASHIEDYNTAANPKFSVGEYWDSTSAISTWISNTKGYNSSTPTSGAFDFQFRYRVRDAINNSNWGGSLSSFDMVMKQSGMAQYSVTFIENHDTEYRSSTAQQDPIRKDTLAANAFLLAMPGTPCIFYKHWQSYKKDLKLMIEARKHAGVENTSTFKQMESSSTYYVIATTGTKGTLVAAVGPDAAKYATPDGYTEIISGYHYRYFMSNNNLSGWSDIKARIEEEEKPVEFTPYKATVYVKADWSPVYFYAWDSNNSTQLNGAWPGKLMSSTNTTKVNGEDWYYQSFDITSANYYFNIIFNQGTGKPQTTDISRITSDRYFVATLNGTKITYEDVTKTVGIDDVVTVEPKKVEGIYDLSGRRHSTLQKGINIVNGRKILK